MIEGIQGEGGVTPADPAYLLGLRQLCDEEGILLMMDGVQVRERYTSVVSVDVQRVFTLYIKRKILHIDIP